MSSATENAFQDSDVRLLQQMMARIERLEELSVGTAPGLFFPYAAPARSSAFSDSHLEAIAEKWTRHYQLNEINESKAVEDRSGNPVLAGIMKASTAINLPQQGQPGGLVSDGSYSYYFPGAGSSRIEIPLVNELTTAFSLECMVKPEVIPQLSTIFYNGVTGTNGWGLAIGNAAGSAEGNLLLLRHSGGVVVNTGLEFIANQWSWIGVTFSGTTIQIALVSLDPATKVVKAVGATNVPTIVKPTGAAYIGNSSTINTPFKGWIDEVLSYDGNLNIATEAIGSWSDRWHTAIEASPPPGFVLADGTAVGRAKFDRLFKTTGTIYGVGDGSTTFNLPNLKNRVPMGKEAEALGALLAKQFGTAGTVFNLLNVNYLIKT